MNKAPVSIYYVFLFSPFHWFYWSLPQSWYQIFIQWYPRLDQRLRYYHFGLLLRLDG
jgi:hypothetical protein